MKFGREPDRQRLVVAAGVFFLIDVFFQRLDLFARQVTGQTRHHQALKTKANVERVSSFFPTGRRHRRAAIAAKFDKALGGELAQRVADNGAAGAETLADGVLRQLRARLQRLFDNGVAQRPVDQPGPIRTGLCLYLGHCLATPRLKASMVTMPRVPSMAPR